MACTPRHSPFAESEPLIRTFAHEDSCFHAGFGAYESIESAVLIESRAPATDRAGLGASWRRV